MPILHVDIYDIDVSGQQTLRSENVPFCECFPDGCDEDEAADALREIERAGRYWGGGGASPMYLLMRGR